MSNQVPDNQTANTQEEPLKRKRGRPKKTTDTSPPPETSEAANSHPQEPILDGTNTSEQPITEFPSQQTAEESLEQKIMPELKIDPEFQGLITPLTDQELSNLTYSIQTYGLREKIVVCDSTIIDGHNRYQICRDNKIDFETTEMKFPDKIQAKKWIILNQFTRRNLSLANKTYMIGTLYNLVKKNKDANLKKKTKGNSYPSGNSSTQIGELFKASAKSVKTAGAYAKIIDRIADNNIRLIILNHHSNIKIKDILKLRKLSVEDLQLSLKDLKMNSEAIRYDTVNIKRRWISHPDYQNKIKEMPLCSELGGVLSDFINGIKAQVKSNYDDLTSVHCPSCGSAKKFVCADFTLTDEIEFSQMILNFTCGKCKKKYGSIANSFQGKV